MASAFAAAPTNSTNCPSLLRQIFLPTLGILAILLNFLLLLLIRNRTVTIMSGYKKVLYAGCIIDLFSALTQALIQARFSYENKIHVKSLDGPLASFLYQNQLVEDKNLNFIAMLESIALYTTNVFAFVPFLYRYLNVVWNYHPTNSKFLSFCSIIFSVAFLQALFHAIASSSSHEYNIQIIYPMSNKCTPNLPYFDGKFNYNKTGFNMMIFYVVVQGVQILSYLTIPFFGWRIFRFIKQNTKMSQRMIDVNRQISRTISLQAFIPIVCAGLPYAAFFGYTMFNLNNDEAGLKDFFGQIAYESAILIPLTNPIAAILFINSYRQSIFNIFFNIHDQVFKTATVSMSHPASKQMIFTV